MVEVAVKEVSGPRITAFALLALAVSAVGVRAQPISERETLDGDGSAPKTPVAPIFRYINAEGRECFTNIPEKVPKELRGIPYEPGASQPSAAEAPAVAVNTPLTKAETKQTRGQSDRRSTIGWHQWLWRDYQPWVLISAILLFFMVITPTVLAHVSVPQWARTLTCAIEVLTFLSIAIFIATQN